MFFMIFLQILFRKYVVRAVFLRARQYMIPLKKFQFEGLSKNRIRLIESLKMIPKSLKLTEKNLFKSHSVLTSSQMIE